MNTASAHRIVPTTTLAGLAILLSVNWGLLVWDAATNDRIQALLQYDGERIGGGELWRLITFHLVHWDAWHLLVNAVAFVGLGLLYENVFGRWYPLLLLGMAGAIGVGMILVLPSQTIARGLSGLVACQLALAVAWELRRAYHCRKGWWIVLTATAILVVAVYFEWQPLCQHSG